MSRGEGIGGGVRGAEHAVFDREAGQRGAELHLSAIIARGVAGDDITDGGGNIAERALGVEGRNRIAPRADGGFERVGECIQAGLNRNRIGLGCSQVWIENRDARARLGITACHFFMGVIAADERVRLALAPGAGSGRDGDQGQHRLRGLPVPVIVAHDAAIAEQKIAGLGGVHAASAAEGDDAVERLFLREVAAGSGVGFGGVFPGVVVDGHGDARRREQALGVGEMAGARNAPVADQENRGSANLAYARRQLA
jgi:hypothetical protein